MSLALLDDLEQKLRDTVTAHAPELQRAADIAAKVDASPLATVVLGLRYVPASIQTALASTLTQADAEFASLTPPMPAETPVADVSQATPDEATPDAPFGTEPQPEAVRVDPQIQTSVAT